VPSARPVARDNLPGSGGPITVARQLARHDEPSAPTPVTHSYAVLTFFTDGRGRMEQNGRWNLEAGDVLLVPAGQPHRCLEMSRLAYWGLGFCAPCYAADGAATLLEPFERVRDGASAVVRVPAARHAFLEGLFRELADVTREPRGRGEAQAAVQRSLLTLILNEVGRTQSTEDRGARRGGVVADSLRFIERNCLRRLTLNEVAAAVGRSPAYVTTALSQATGRSAVQWIVAGRMAEARRLLLHSDEAIDIIAERVGYADPTHFIRMFRREHSATPAAWRIALARAT
jgi:AraC family transcriptional regulator, transcriptional activator of pobA